MTDEELQEMIDEADRDGDGEVSAFALFPTRRTTGKRIFSAVVSMPRWPFTGLNRSTSACVTSLIRNVNTHEARVRAACVRAVTT
jgi:hypothetical protein